MMDTIKIDKDIPVPSRNKDGRWNKYPWDQMEVGDSFFVAKSRDTMASVAHSTGKRKGMTFTTSAVEGGTRVWRVK